MKQFNFKMSSLHFDYKIIIFQLQTDYILMTKWDFIVMPEDFSGMIHLSANDTTHCPSYHRLATSWPWLTSLGYLQVD